MSGILKWRAIDIEIVVLGRGPSLAIHVGISKLKGMAWAPFIARFLKE